MKIQTAINKINKTLHKLKPTTELILYNPITKQAELKTTINNKTLYIEYDTLSKTFHNPLNNTHINTNELIHKLNYAHNSNRTISKL